MSKSRSRRKEPIRHDPADLSNVVACLGEIKNIMLLLIEEIERIKTKSQEKSIPQEGDLPGKE